MKIAIDITPLKEERVLWHRVRGTGFYIENLKKSLETYFPQNQYLFFTRKEKLPQDVDLIHYPYFEPFFLSLPIFKGKKTVVTVHDLTPLVFPQYFPSGIRGRLKWGVQKCLLKKAEAIITDSENSKQDIVRLTGFPKEKVHVVYLAPAAEFRQIKDTLLLDRIREKYKLPKEFVLYVGDVTWNKNLPRLLEAVKTLDFPLVLVGKALTADNYDKDNVWNQDLVKVQTLAKNNTRILRLGFVPTEDLVVLYNLATVFVMPSIYEGFGLPVLEAMACGTPVVASKTSSLPEICGEAAILVDPYDRENLAKAIEKVVKDTKERNLLVEKGLIQASKFSWEKTTKETMRIYKKIYEKI
ncbi:MAG: glycosyltransferase family 4 protein [Patescibacteria group bacterium]|nr:glycosyltransferase family 4 protein [Patescibacteria group bacterium]MCL5095179.1 glycosyltransferase family 4 protein [Patescibacteria group bacterium]